MTNQTTDEEWIIEIALNRKPDSIEYDEKHILIIADTNKEAAQKAYTLADDLFPEWSHAEVFICGAERTTPTNFKTHNEIQYAPLD